MRLVRRANFLLRCTVLMPGTGQSSGHSKLCRTLRAQGRATNILRTPLPPQADPASNQAPLRKPEMPSTEMCCGNECHYCVFTVYLEELEEYETAMRRRREMETNPEQDKE